jgi:biotin carboxyl carrier protein
VLEAMKMQNEFRASVAGTVKEIRVAVGQVVNAGDVLLVIE